MLKLRINEIYILFHKKKYIFVLFHKKGTTITNAFQKILDESTHKPNKNLGG